MLPTVFALIVLISAVATTQTAQARPKAQLRGNVLKVTVPARDLTPLIDRYLNKTASGYIINSKTQTAYIKNFRSSFQNGGIKIRFDYNVKRRGSTKTFIGGTAYGPWIKDSGWIEVTVWTGVRHWKLYSYTRNGYVRWRSNNWFTNQVRGLFDQKIRDNVTVSVNNGLASATGGRYLNLKTLAVKHGASVIARQTGRSTRDVSRSMYRAFNRTKLHVGVKSYGLVATLALPKDLLPKRIKKIRYSIYNGSGRTVRVRMSPTGNVYRFRPGQTRSFTSSQVNGRLPSLYVYNSRRSYQLTSGQHKFWWNRTKNRIGFDRNYKQ